MRPLGDVVLLTGEKQAMKLSIFTVSLLASLYSALSACAGAQSTEALRLPPGIVQYYGDANFVAAFMTVDERVALRGARRGDAPPPNMNSPRMKEIRERLSRLHARILRSDQGIVAHGINTEGAFPHGLLRITAARCGPNEILLQATIRRLDPATHARLIAAYEETTPKSPTDEEIARRLNTIQGESKLQVELHRWMLTDGVWMKQEVDLMLLEGSPAFISNCG
jgi:hypothetical protein